MFTIPSNSDMSFPPLTCKVLEEYSIRPPKNENLWLGPWLTILTTLFPADNYLVSTQIKTYSERDAKGRPDLILEVAKPNLSCNMCPFFVSSAGTTSGPSPPLQPDPLVSLTVRPTYHRPPPTPRCHCQHLRPPLFRHELESSDTRRQGTG